MRTGGSERGVSESEFKEIGLKHVVKGTEYFKKRCDIILILLVSLWIEIEKTRTGETKPKKVNKDRTNKEEEKGSWLWQCQQSLIFSKSLLCICKTTAFQNIVSFNLPQTLLPHYYNPLFIDDKLRHWKLKELPPQFTQQVKRFLNQACLIPKAHPLNWKGAEEMSEWLFFSSKSFLSIAAFYKQ